MFFKKIINQEENIRKNKILKKLNNQYFINFLIHI